MKRDYTRQYRKFGIAGCFDRTYIFGFRWAIQRPTGNQAVPCGAPNKSGFHVDRNEAMDPIAITSVGIVSPVGLCADSFWTVLTQPRDLRSAWSRGDLSPYPVDKVNGIAPALWTSLALQGEDGAPHIAELARYATEQAPDSARLPARHGRIGCMFGTTTGGGEAIAVAAAVAILDLLGTGIRSCCHRHILWLVRQP